MKRNIKLMAFVAAIVTLLTSCGGGSSVIFGNLPEIYLEYKAKDKALKEAGDKNNWYELRHKYLLKMEDEVAALNDKEIDLKSTDDIKVTSPLKIEYQSRDPFDTQNYSFNIEFKAHGNAEAATDMIIEAKEMGNGCFKGRRNVLLVGYDSNGEKTFENYIGKIDCEYEGGKAFIATGTPIKFRYLMFYGRYAEDYLRTAELKLVVK